MLQNADEQILSLKHNADALLAKDEKLQEFLTWYSHLAVVLNVPYKAPSIRAFYLDLEIANIHPLVNIIMPLNRLSYYLDFKLEMDWQDFGYGLELDCAIARILSEDNLSADNLVLNITRNLHHPFLALVRPYLVARLQQIKYQPPNPDDQESFRAWWQKNGQAWIEELRAVMSADWYISPDWQFSEQQKELLKQYYDANKALVKHLNTSELSPKVRQEIEDTLLLPIAEIEKRKQ